MSPLADAYVWGYPLVAMHRTRAAHRGGSGLVARSRLATAADRAVVAPNNDTLYASGWFDLNDGDLTLSVGPIERYWSVMLLDAYTNVAYVCRRIHGTEDATVRLTYDPSVPPVTDAAADVLTLGTPTVWVLARVVVAGPHDLATARAALGRISVHPAGGRIAARPPVGHGFFGELHAALAVDPPAPWHPAPPTGLAEMLSGPTGAAGVADEVAAEAISHGRRRIAASTGPDRARNGWGTRLRGADFGGDVAYRAAFARTSLAGHLPAENRSYNRRFDGSTRASLRFESEPPVDGFWSLCVYGPDLFLVDNEIDRHSIGDRTPGLRRDADGSITITLGHQRPDETANWLPTPDGPCVLALRAYEGQPEVVAADWFPPDLEPMP